MTAENEVGSLTECLERMKQAHALSVHILTCPIQSCQHCIEAAELFERDQRKFVRYYTDKVTALIYGLQQIAYGKSEDPAEFAKQILMEANEWPPRVNTTL